MKPPILSPGALTPRQYPLAKSSAFAAGALLLSASSHAATLFLEDFGFDTTPAALHGSANGSGIFSGAWQVQNADTSIPGYNIVSTTPLTGAAGNYAIGGDGYQSTTRGLSEDAAFLIDPALRYDPDANPFNGNEAVGGNGSTLFFSAVVRKDTAGQSFSVGVGTNYFDGGGFNSTNTGIGIGDEDGNGFLDLFSRGTTVNSTIPYVLGTSYLMSVEAVYANTGTAAVLTLSIDGTPTSATINSSDATFLQLGYNGGNQNNRSSIDNITLTSIPEPGSAALGLLGVLGILRRRR